MTDAAVILAAGGGSRFAGSTHKLLAPFRGAPLWTWACAHAVAAGLDHTIVITGAAALDVPSPAVEVHNERWAGGIATSLQVAVRWAEEHGCDAIVAGLGDQPFTSPKAWRRVASVTRKPIVFGTYSGKPGHPVRLAKDVWPFLPSVGDDGARVVARLRPDQVAEVPCPGTAADVDTQEDLRRLA
jgi:CTP:molybdopterin cytidylyltransferase MocA